MKKLLLSAVVAVLSISNVSAQETIATLFEGSQNVTWVNTLLLEASKFENVNVGDYIYITFESTTDVIELKSDGTWLPGSRFTWLGEGVEDYRCYITADGLNALKTNGLELCGANFTVSGVSIMNDGFVMPEGAVWGGYFWIDNWNTLEIWKTAFSNYNGEKYMVINLSEDNGDNTNYVMQVMTAFDKPEAVIGSNDKGNETKTNKMTVIDLTNVNLLEMLETTDRVLVQGNPEGGNPFNITSIVLTNTNPLGGNGDDNTSVGLLISANDKVSVYNLQGIVLKSEVKVKDALHNLPAGTYILRNGKNSIKVIK